MKRILILCALPITLAWGADETAMIARMREAALSYDARLQDFLCNQLTTRSADQSGSGKRWKLLETREMELGYVSHREHYKLLKVNGKPARAEKGVKKGYFRPGLEFGTSLRQIFNDRAAAKFEWDHEESSAGTRSCVFRYSVPLETTTYMMVADADHVRLAHHGFVTSDCDTGAVTRIQIETEPASVRRMGRDIAIGVQLDVVYGPVKIADKEFLLPTRAVEIARFYKTLTKVELEFRDYRKYDSDSTVVFDDEPADPGK